MAYTQEELYWIWLSSIEGIGYISFNKLMSVVKQPKEIFQLAQKNSDLLDVLSTKARTNLCTNANKRYIEKLFSQFREKDIKPICQTNELYPKKLFNMYDPPLVLYCLGNTDLLKSPLSIGVVGTRRPTYYGKKTAVSICENLGREGITVVSGMARGIDAASHIGCLKGKGKTIAVLGCGVDIIYPKENEGLYNDILSNHGLVVSDYIHQTIPHPGNFPARNRIISGLSSGVVVVEAAERSGTSFTVNYAIEQGKVIFAVPGNINSKYSKAPNRLIKEGAEVLTSHEDILDYFNWKISSERTLETINDASLEEKALIEMLINSEISFDEIYQSTDYTIPQLSELLVMMELKGMIKQLPGRRYTT